MAFGCRLEPLNTSKSPLEGTDHKIQERGGVDASLRQGGEICSLDSSQIMGELAKRSRLLMTLHSNKGKSESVLDDYVLPTDGAPLASLTQVRRGDKTRCQCLVHLMTLYQIMMEM